LDYESQNQKLIIMKKYALLFITLLLVISYSSCDLLKDDDDPNSIDGDQSPMGVVGATVSSSSSEIAGVSNFSGTVTSVSDKTSLYTGSCVCKNQFLKNLCANIPELVLSGDNISTTNVKFKNTKEGIELKTGNTQGVIAKYSSNVGDKYRVSGGGERVVVSKSTTDDYYYGFFLIKVMAVEEVSASLQSMGINKITYWANHKYGLVGVDFSFSDGSSGKFPIYSSGEN
jgi:hypothetical protein